MNRFRTEFTRVLIGFLGWTIILLGIVLLPLPGPGWAIIFIGISVLATRYKWAKQLHHYGHDTYAYWRAWMKRQPPWIDFLFWLLSVMTLFIVFWFSGFLALAGDFVDLDWGWTRSPIL